MNNVATTPAKTGPCGSILMEASQVAVVAPAQNEDNPTLWFVQAFREPQGRESTKGLTAHNWKEATQWIVRAKESDNLSYDLGKECQEIP